MVTCLTHRTALEGGGGELDVEAAGIGGGKCLGEGRRGSDVAQNLYLKRFLLTSWLIGAFDLDNCNPRRIQAPS